MRYLIIILFCVSTVNSAEFLILAKKSHLETADKTNWTVNKLSEYNRRYVVGDIIQVYPNGTCTEQPSPNSRMYILKVPDLDYETVKEYMQPDINPETDELIKRRKFMIDIPSIPLNIRNQIKDDRWITVNWDTVKQYLIRK